MFETEWAQRKLWKLQTLYVQPSTTKLNANDVYRTTLLRWEEHCLECSPPECYSNCALYVARGGKACARFVYGIYPNRAFKGLFNWGADLQFRRWAKLETKLYTYPVPVGLHRFLGYADRCGSRLFNSMLVILPRRLATVFRRMLLILRVRPLRRISRRRGGDWDAFVLECFSPNNDSFRLVLEYTDTKVRYRNAFHISPGHNYFEIPWEQFSFRRNPPTGKLTLYPENNAEPRLIFTWLDFVEYKKGLCSKIDEPQSVRAAAKVKCVAWDLDNTLWQGTLIEDGAENLKLCQDAIEVIKNLDKRGILQTVVSKNNHDQAWAIIEKFGLKEYFLYPAINWAPKSSNLRQIAAKLNINIDTFALIDDSPFERIEVHKSLPQVRVYPKEEIPTLLSRAEFDIHVTEMSKKRRLSYLANVERERVREEFNGDYENFLRTCQMKMTIFIPKEEKDINRCWELIQRSNQLNLSIRRYSTREFNELCSTQGILCLAFHCADKFGDYGIVGFASVDERNETVRLVDFVISCRVAQKRVEHTFVGWLAQREKKQKKKALQVRLTKTKRNGPLVRVFEDLPFRTLEENNQYILIELSLDRKMAAENVICLEARVRI